MIINGYKKIPPEERGMNNWMPGIIYIDKDKIESMFIPVVAGKETFMLLTGAAGTEYKITEIFWIQAVKKLMEEGEGNDSDNE